MCSSRVVFSGASSPLLFQRAFPLSWSSSYILAAQITHPLKTSPPPGRGSQRFPGVAAVSGYQHFSGVSAGSRQLIGLPACSSPCNFHPCPCRVRARTDKNQAWEQPSCFSSSASAPPGSEMRQDPIPGTGSLACFGCQLPRAAFQKAPACPRCQQAVSACGLSLE